jgi:Glycerol kinase
MKFVLSIDQGTTSSRAILFDQYLNPAFKAQKEFRQLFPKSCWVEHDPDEIWKSVVFVCKEVLKKANIDASQIISIGITNQRETTLVWEKNSGRPIHNAIVWQDRRTRKICDDLRRDGHEKMVSEKTGLLLDPYFSATKIKWLIEKFKEQSTKFNEGEYIFGTDDTFLIWRLTNGMVHATDATNASRTMLYDIEKE